MSDRNRVVLDNVGLVYQVVNRMARAPGRTIEDDEQAGMEGLVKAAATFELGHGAKFSTWATLLITQAVLRDRDRESGVNFRMASRRGESYRIPGSLDAVDALGVSLLDSLEQEQECIGGGELPEGWGEVAAFMSDRDRALCLMHKELAARELGLAVKSVDTARMRVVRRLRAELGVAS